MVRSKQNTGPGESSSDVSLSVPGLVVVEEAEDEAKLVLGLVVVVEVIAREGPSEEDAEEAVEEAWSVVVTADC